MARDIANVIHEVPTRLLPDLWPLVREFVERAMDHHPLLDAEEALQILYAGKAQLLVVSDDGRIVAAAVMQVIAYPSSNAALILGLGGESNSFNRRHLNETYKHLEAWAKARGCGIIHAFGRAGWRRFASRFGWSVKPVVLGWKEL